MCFNTEISILDSFIVACEVHYVGVYHLVKWKNARWNTEIGSELFRRFFNYKTTFTETILSEDFCR